MRTVESSRIELAIPATGKVIPEDFRGQAVIIHRSTDGVRTAEMILGAAER